LQDAKHVIGLAAARPQAQHNACSSSCLAAFAGQGELRLLYDMQSGLLNKGMAKQPIGGKVQGLSPQSQTH
jgi:hypothetical protein